MSNYIVCPGDSIKTFYKGYEIRIWNFINRVELNEIPINIKITDDMSYDDICEEAVKYFKKEILPYVNDAQIK